MPTKRTAKTGSKKRSASKSSKNRGQELMDRASTLAARTTKKKQSTRTLSEERVLGVDLRANVNLTGSPGTLGFIETPPSDKKSFASIVRERKRKPSARKSKKGGK